MPVVALIGAKIVLAFFPGELWRSLDEDHYHDGKEECSGIRERVLLDGSG